MHGRWLHRKCWVIWHAVRSRVLGRHVRTGLPRHAGAVWVVWSSLLVALRGKLSTNLSDERCGRSAWHWTRRVGVSRRLVGNVSTVTNLLTRENRCLLSRETECLWTALRWDWISKFGESSRWGVLSRRQRRVGIDVGIVSVGVTRENSSRTNRLLYIRMLRGLWLGGTDTSYSCHRLSVSVSLSRYLHVCSFNICGRNVCRWTMGRQSLWYLNKSIIEKLIAFQEKKVDKIIE